MGSKSMAQRIAIALSLAILFISSSFATVYITTTTVDDENVTGSFRYCYENASEFDRIEFNIPVDQGTLMSGSTVWVIQWQGSIADYQVDNSVIDGRTQSTFIGEDTNPYGPEIVLDMNEQDVFAISADTVTVYGMVFNNSNNVAGFGTIRLNGSYNKIRGCYVAINATGTHIVSEEVKCITWGSPANYCVVGGSDPAWRNVITGASNEPILIDSTADYTEISYNYIGTDYTGNNDLDAASWPGIKNNGGDFCTIRSNVIGGGCQDAIYIGGGSYGNLVENNNCGIGANGLTALLVSQDGIELNNASSNTITGNVIGNCNLRGINHQNTASFGNYIYQNYIGVDRFGHAHPTVRQAIWLAEGSYINISSNIISHAGWPGGTRDGIDVDDDNTDHVVILGNSIYNNTNLGISRSNTPIAAPVITEATSNFVKGTSEAGALVEIFISSTASVGTGSVQGITYLNHRYADGSGNFYVPINCQAIDGQYITATQTNDGDTSMFADEYEVIGLKYPKQSVKILQ